LWEDLPWKPVQPFFDRLEQYSCQSWKLWAWFPISCACRWLDGFGCKIEQGQDRVDDHGPACPSLDHRRFDTIHTKIICSILECRPQDGLERRKVPNPSMHKTTYHNSTVCFWQELLNVTRGSFCVGNSYVCDLVQQPPNIPHMWTEKSSHQVLMCCISNLFHISHNGFLKHASRKRSAVDMLILCLTSWDWHTIRTGCDSTKVDATHIVFRRLLLIVADCVGTSDEKLGKWISGTNYRTFTNTTFSLMKPINQLNRSLRRVNCPVISGLCCTTSGSDFVREELYSNSNWYLPDFKTAELSCSAPCISESSFKSGGKLNRSGFWANQEMMNKHRLLSKEYETDHWRSTV